MGSSDPHELARQLVEKLSEHWTIVQYWIVIETGDVIDFKDLLAALRVMPEVLDE